MVGAVSLLKSEEAQRIILVTEAARVGVRGRDIGLRYCHVTWDWVRNLGVA